jgi:hypothetical protein
VSRGRHVRSLLWSAVVTRINSERRTHDATAELPQPSLQSEGTAWLVGSSNLITDWPGRTRMLFCNEVDNLVTKPSLAGHKSEKMMSPASR